MDQWFAVELCFSETLPELGGNGVRQVSDILFNLAWRSASEDDSRESPIGSDELDGGGTQAGHSMLSRQLHEQLGFVKDFRTGLLVIQQPVYFTG